MCSCRCKCLHMFRFLHNGHCPRKNLVGWLFLSFLVQINLQSLGDAITCWALGQKSLGPIFVCAEFDHFIVDPSLPKNIYHGGYIWIMAIILGLIVVICTGVGAKKSRPSWPVRRTNLIFLCDMSLVRVLVQVHFHVHLHVIVHCNVQCIYLHVIVHRICICDCAYVISDLLTAWPSVSQSDSMWYLWI